MLIYGELKKEGISVSPEKLNVVNEGTRRECFVKECVHGKFGMV
jgi:hypothetical protein